MPLSSDGYFPPRDDESSSDSSSDSLLSSSNSQSTSASSAPSTDCQPTTISTPIFPFPRPYSLHNSPSTSDSSAYNRHSASSLPLPHSVPFHTLLQSDPPSHPARVRQAHRSEILSESPHYGYPSAGPSSSSSTSSFPSPSPDTPPPIEHPQSYSYPNSFDSALRRHRSNPRLRPTTSPTTASTGVAVADSNSFYPAPDPPTILAPTVPPGPFLSHAPPPPDSWIHVETSASEYKLVVRLPGFKRDGITLATKRRRILHVVADCWDNGGGHFERRISFGYDADLVQVRAEFDGEMLRVNIPRRLPPATSISSTPGPVGRSG